MRTTWLAGVWIGSIAMGCAPTVLPPPAAPAQVMPPVVNIGAPPPGSGQVTFDAEQPSLVEEVTGHMEGVTSGGYAVSGLDYKTVCARTPCAGNLALGPHDVRLSSLDQRYSGSGSVIVTQQPSNYRFAFGHGTDASVGGGLTLLSLGFSGLITGPILIAIGDNGGLGPNLTPYGEITLLGAIVATVVGGILLYNGRGTTQDGTGVQWAGPPTMSGAPGAMP